MLASFAALLLFQCLGEGITFALRLPIPGPVVGMLLLFAALLLYPPLLDKIEATGSALLQHLSLLFVPAGVGIVATAGQVHGHWLTVILAVVISTLLTLAVTAAVMRAVMQWQQRHTGHAGSDDSSGAPDE
jgi:holin-like protein